MMTLMCFDSTTKEQLLSNGYNLLCEKIIDGKKAYVFLNNGKSFNFDNKKVIMTNKMMF